MEKLNTYAENLLDLSAKLNELSDIIFEEISNLNLSKAENTSLDITEDNFKEVIEKVLDYIDETGNGEEQIIDFVSNQFDPSNVFSTDDIVESAKNCGCLSIYDKFSDDEIMDYVSNNYYPEDLVEMSFRF